LRYHPRRSKNGAVDPIIDLAPGADDNPLAVELGDRIRARLAQKSRKLTDFRALRGTIMVVAQDTAESLTLRFDHGRLTIHDGAIGIPAVTFCADRAVLQRLADMPLLRWLRLPVRAWSRLVAPLSRGELKIYGLVTHPRLVLTFLRLLSPDG
jgi:hypothetical protein